MGDIRFDLDRLRADIRNEGCNLGWELEMVARSDVMGVDHVFHSIAAGGDLGYRTRRTVAAVHLDSLVSKFGRAFVAGKP